MQLAEGKTALDAIPKPVLPKPSAAKSAERPEGAEPSSLEKPRAKRAPKKAKIAAD
jgi:hypothetical protein